MLPRQFNDRGVLDTDYEATITELRDSLLVHGPETSIPDWNKPWRETLVTNLEIIVQQLWNVGVTQIYVDGSFVTSKPHPRDIDVCFVCDFRDWATGSLQERLNHAAPKKVWTWDESEMRPVAGFGTMKLPMWISYRVDLHPHFPDSSLRMLTDFGEQLSIVDAFRRNRDGSHKGIVILNKDNKGGSK